MANKDMIYSEVREICMEHLKINFDTRIEEEVDEATQAVTKVTYGAVKLSWDNQPISESPEQELSRITELPETGPTGGGMPGGAGL